MTPVRGGVSSRAVAAPSMATIAAGYNTRLEGLDKLWARLTWRVTGRNARSEEIDEAFEGHLQLKMPRRVAITATKLGETYLYVGSDEKRYWWIDRASDPAAAYVGDHMLVTPGKLSRQGVFLHPLDLVEVLGITPLDPAEKPQELRVAEDGSIIVLLSARLGLKRLWLDPRTFRPTRIELFGRDATRVARAELSDFVFISVRGDGTVRPSLPTELNIVAGDPRTMGGGLSIRMRLFDPEGREPKPAALDFESLLERFEVSNVTNLDQATPAPAVR